MPTKRNVFKIIFVFLILLLASCGILVIYLINNPDLTVNLNPTVAGSEVETHMPVETDSLRRLKLDNIFWMLRLNLADNKDIHLLVDFPEKELLLEIQGVTVFHVPIIYYNENDALLTLYQSTDLENWLHKPFELADEWASIAKEPIQVRDIRPGSVNRDDILVRFRDPEADQEVIIYLYFTNQLTIAIKQIETIPDSSDINILLRENQLNISPYYLEIFIDQEAARTIYRALSVKKSHLVLRPE